LGVVDQLARRSASRDDHHVVCAERAANPTGYEVKSGPIDDRRPSGTNVPGEVGYKSHGFEPGHRVIYSNEIERGHAVIHDESDSHGRLLSTMTFMRHDRLK